MLLYTVLLYVFLNSGKIVLQNSSNCFGSLLGQVKLIYSHDLPFVISDAGSCSFSFYQFSMVI